MGNTVCVFHNEYIVLGKHCREFAVAHLDNCRTSEEVSLLLSQPSNTQYAGPTVGQYPRLRMALDYEQKEVGLQHFPHFNKYICSLYVLLVLTIFGMEMS